MINQTEFYAQIAEMESKRWIDEYSSLVQVACEFENININTAMSLLMSIEFTRSGAVLAEAPFVGLGPAVPPETPTSFSPVLLLGFYPLFVQICLFILNIKYVEKQDFSFHHISFSEWNMFLTCTVTCTACLAAWYFNEVIRTGDVTPADEDHHQVFSLYTIRYQAQIAHGYVFLGCSFVILSMCDVIPRFNIIGRTLYRSIPHLFRFCLLVVVVMAGFGLLFWTVFRTTIPDFRYPSYAAFTLFRGMLGDMPLDDMLYNQPLTTKVLYFIFTFFVVFVIFNVVIAIIMDAYSDVKDETEAEAKKAEEDSKKTGETHHDSLFWCVPSCILDIPVIGWCLKPIPKEEEEEDGEDPAATNQYMMAQKIEDIHQHVMNLDQYQRGIRRAGDVSLRDRSAFAGESSGQWGSGGGCSDEKLDLLAKQIEGMNQNIQALQQQMMQLQLRSQVLSPGFPSNQTPTRQLPPI